MHRNIERITFLTGIALLLFLLLGSLSGVVQAVRRAQAVAWDILSATSTRGGLVVHVGRGDGRLTAALRAGPGYVTQGLDRDVGDVQTTRDLLARRDLYGPVSARRWRGEHLPYVNNLVDLLVVSGDADDVPEKEMMRVLSPRGTACVKRSDGWQKRTKPRPRELDDWTHALYDSSNNAVSSDTAVEPPRSRQRFSEPRWSRHHELMSSISAMVPSGRSSCKVRH